MVELTARISSRLSIEAEKQIRELMRLYPEEYPNKSQVLRAGVFALTRWKRKRAADHLDDILAYIDQKIPENRVRTLHDAPIYS